MTASLVRAIDGWVLEWQWEPGLTPDAIADALGVEVIHAPAFNAGRDRYTGSCMLPDHPWALLWLWDQDLELLKVELPEPQLLPSVEAVRTELGEPSTKIDFRLGPHPGNAQFVYLERGITLFDGGNMGITYLWLFRPTDEAGYVDGLAATSTPVRMPRRH